ncbi:hypothetical protein [Nocardia phage KYD2]|nr:hypothetical protein [Nocardia phage KYD2]
MSEAKYYQLRCDQDKIQPGTPKCPKTFVGNAFETPSRIRRRLKTQGWTQVPVPQTAWQKEHGIESTAKWDRCPDHPPA